MDESSSALTSSYVSLPYGLGCPTNGAQNGKEEE